MKHDQTSSGKTLSNDTTYKLTHTDWYNTVVPSDPWLVHGLLAYDSHSAVVGKPKSGKSRLARVLAVAIVKGHTFLGRQVNVCRDSGKVLFLHLDRKDPIHDVAQDFKQLGITDKDVSRLRLLTPNDMPKDKASRIPWLQEQVQQFTPDLIVIDLLFQFVSTPEGNNYNQVLEKINELQDALTAIGYKGHTMTVHHARKAFNPKDPFDDMLGSTSIRASFATNIAMIRERDDEKSAFIILTEQTQHAQDENGKKIDDIPLTQLIMDADGDLHLGERRSQLVADMKQYELDGKTFRLLQHISTHPKCTEAEILAGARISKTTFRELLVLCPEIHKAPEHAKKGEPYKYYIEVEEAPVTAVAPVGGIQ